MASAPHTKRLIVNNKQSFTPSPDSSAHPPKLRLGLLRIQELKGANVLRAKGSGLPHSPLPPQAAQAEKWVLEMEVRHRGGWAWLQGSRHKGLSVRM